MTAIFCLHFTGYFAQGFDTLWEGLMAVGPLMVPIFAYRVALLFLKRSAHSQSHDVEQAAVPGQTLPGHSTGNGDEYALGAIGASTAA